MKQLLPYMRKYALYAILCPILMILEVFADIAVPYLMSRIVDVGIVNSDVDYVLKVGLIMILASLLGMLFGGLSSYAGARAGYGFAAEIRSKTFKRFKNLPLQT